MKLNDFMRNLTAAFKKKSGQPCGPEIRKAYGGAIAYLKKNPHDVLELSLRLDRMPPGKPPAFYVESVRMLVAELNEERKKREAENRPHRLGQSAESVASILKGLMPAGGGG